MEFQLAGKSDLSNLAEMAREFYRIGGLNFVEAEFKRAAEGLLSDRTKGFVYLARSTENVYAGYIVVTFGFSLEFDGGFALIDEFYIREAFRGTGIGTSLLEFIIRTCREAGLNAVRLEVDRTNEKARALYERHGFISHDREFLTRLVREADA